MVFFYGVLNSSGNLKTAFWPRELLKCTGVIISWLNELNEHKKFYEPYL